jgi:signal transduction histidine kinase
MNNPTLFAAVAILFLLAGLLLGYPLYQLLSSRKSVRERQHARREAERLERERSLTIYKLVSALSATLNYQKVLETALDMTSSALTVPSEPADRGVSAFFLFTPDENDPKKMRLRVGSARRFTPADMRILLDGTAGLLGKVIDQGEAVLSKSIAQDPELSRIIALRSCTAAFCIPLRASLDTYGVLLFAHPETDYFSPERRETLSIIGNQAMIALQNARLYRDLEMEKERMMEIQEEARKKLARDLHDGPTQSVAAIAMRVNFARRLLSRDLSTATDELGKIEDLARRTTKEIRHMLFTLRPLVLESKGLAAALEAMAEKMRETYAQNVIVDAEPEAVEKLESGKQAVIFYIAEEAVNNARKHAEAAHIWVRLKMVQPDLALLAVEDDGVGFNVGAVDSTYESRSSLGMINMRERAELINGVLHIDSAEGRGTRIHVAIPLTEEAVDRLHQRRSA